MVRLRAADPSEWPPDAVVMSRTLSNIDRVEHSTFMLRDGAPMTPMSDHACLADAMGLLSVEDVDALLPLYEPVYRDGLLRQRIRTMVIEGRLEDAHATAELMRKPLRGHRDAGHHLAERGDHARFFGEWPRYEPRRATQELVGLRQRLVAAVGRREGPRAALHLVQTHKRLGEKYVMAALASAEIARFDELVPLLEGELAGLVDEPAACSLLVELVDQLLRELPSGAEAEDPRLRPLAERIGRLDGDRPLRQMRDSMLFRLWPLIAEHSTLTRVRALVRTPSIRRELTQLPSEVTARSER